MRVLKVSTALERSSLFFQPWYGLATVLYMAGITFLSSVPRPPRLHPPVLQYALNLGHIPLFAGLTYLLIRTIAPRWRPFLTTRACVLTAVALAAFAALDELHQAFVPGRSASPTDLLLDMMGIGAVLLFHRLSALVSEEP